MVWHSRARCLTMHIVHVTAKADYAVRAILELADSSQSAPRKVDQIAKAQAIPVSFLENILTQLRSAVSCAVSVDPKAATGSRYPRTRSASRHHPRRRGPAGGRSREPPEEVEYEGPASRSRRLGGASRDDAHRSRERHRRGRRSGPCRRMYSNLRATIRLEGAPASLTGVRWARSVPYSPSRPTGVQPVRHRDPVRRRADAGRPRLLARAERRPEGDSRLGSRLRRGRRAARRRTSGTRRSRPVADHPGGREDRPLRVRGAAQFVSDPTGLMIPIVNEELFWGDAGIGLAIMGSALAAAAIFGQGTGEQMGEWIPRCFGTPRTSRSRPSAPPSRTPARTSRRCARAHVRRGDR